ETKAISSCHLRSRIGVFHHQPGLASAGSCGFEVGGVGTCASGSLCDPECSGAIPAADTRGRPAHGARYCTNPAGRRLSQRERTTTRSGGWSAPAQEYPGRGSAASGDGGQDAGAGAGGESGAVECGEKSGPGPAFARTGEGVGHGTGGSPGGGGAG